MDILVKPELDYDTKRLLIELVKTLKLDETVIEDEYSRKWYVFGAYDFARLLTEKIKEL